jgi:hypothetical protein
MAIEYACLAYYSSYNVPKVTLLIMRAVKGQLAHKILRGLMNTEPGPSKFHAGLGDCCVVVQGLGSQVPAEAKTPTVQDLLVEEAHR